MKAKGKRKQLSGRSAGQQGRRAAEGRPQSERRQSAASGAGAAAAVTAGTGKGAALGSLPVALNGTYEAEIVGISHEGEGAGRVNGFTLFVGGALPGERALVKVEHLKKQYGHAKLLQVLEASPERVQPACGIYEQCGGCQLQHLSYEAQLKTKRQLVVDNLERIGKLKVRGSGRPDETGERGNTGNAGDHGNSGDSVNPGNPGNLDNLDNLGLDSEDDPKKAGSTDCFLADGVVVHPTLGMQDPWRYRNKAQVPFGEEEGGLIGGFYAQGSHRIIDMEKCLIQHEHNDEIVARVKEIGRRLGITAYNEKTHQGLLRHVVVKVGFRTGDIMVVLITNGEKIVNVNEWVEGIRAALPGVRSICQNINTKRTNVIFGDVTQVLWGSEVIHDYIGDVKFAISPRSFFQVNPVQTEVLYGKALEYAGLSGGETVVDAYCGIGTISLFLAKRAEQVYGVEIVEEAIADARKNAELNGIRNVHFETGRAEEVLPAWQRQGVKPDVIVVDPPRKGCEPSLLATILELQPRRVVYVASTLARDLRVLEDGGYRTVEVQPVDMFPHTVHVECVVSTYRADLL